MTKHHPSWLPLVVFAGLIVAWGYSWVLMKVALLDAGPLNYASQRTMIAAAALLCAIPLTGGSLKPIRFKELILLGFVQTTLFVGLAQYALVDGGAGRSAVLVFTMPFWMLLFAAIFLHERISRGQAIAVGFAAIGLVVMLKPWALAGTVQSKMIAVGAGMIWAASAIIAKRIQNREAIDVVALTAWQMLYGAILLSVFAAAFDHTPTQWTPRYIGILVFSALVPTGLGWLVWLYLLQRLSAGVAGLSTLAVPVFASLSSAFHLGERLQFHEVMGVILIVFALFLLSLTAISAQRRAHRSK